MTERPLAYLDAERLASAELLAGILEEHHVDVERFSASEEASLLATLHTGEPDLLILDGASGPDRVERLSRIATQYDVPTVVVLADAERALNFPCVQEGRVEAVIEGDVWRWSPIACRLAMPRHRTQRHWRRFEELVALQQRLAKARTEAEIEHIVVSAAAQVTDASDAALILRQAGLAKVVCAEGDWAASYGGWEGSAEGTLVGEAMRRGETLVIQDVQATSSEQPEGAVRLQQLGIRSVALVPIEPEDPCGVLGCAWKMPNEATVVRVAWMQGLASAVQGALRNIRTRAELEQRIADRTEALKASNEELEAFAYSVSHDLRAPLRIVAGFGEVLQNDFAGPLGDEGREHLERMLRATGHMASLIDHLLRLSKISRTELVRTSVNVSERAEAICQRLDAERGGGTRWSVEAGMQLPVDPQLLDLALENLLSNAFKFSNRVAEPRVEVSTHSEGGLTGLRVRDNGVGFDATVLRSPEQLFGAFRRLHSAQEYPGTGVGLAIVKRVATKHGGSVRFEAQPGEGACFYLLVSPTQEIPVNEGPSEPTQHLH